MKIKLLGIGKTDSTWLQTGIDQYLQRLQHYTNFEVAFLKSIKSKKPLDQGQLLEAEAALFSKHLTPRDYIILLDESGKASTSKAFAQLLQQQMNQSTANLVFLIGGAYGFHPSIYQRGNQKLSLSPMTFTHQMVRLIFIEQLYRALTILNNEPYHH